MKLNPELRSLDLITIFLIECFFVHMGLVRPTYQGVVQLAELVVLLIESDIYGHIFCFIKGSDCSCWYNSLQIIYNRWFLSPKYPRIMSVNRINYASCNWHLNIQQFLSSHVQIISCKIISENQSKAKKKGNLSISVINRYNYLSGCTKGSHFKLLS